MKKVLTTRMLNFKRDDSTSLRKKYYDVRYSSYKQDIRLVFIYRLEKLIKHSELKINQFKNQNKINYC